MQDPKNRRRATIAGAGLATVTAAWYANDKYAISHDIKTLLDNRNFAKRVNERIAELGDNFSIYATTKLADQDAEALWFEGRTWTYRQLLMGMSNKARTVQLLTGCHRSRQDCHVLLSQRHPRRRCSSMLHEQLARDGV